MNNNDDFKPPKSEPDKNHDISRTYGSDFYGQESGTGVRRQNMLE